MTSVSSAQSWAPTRGSALRFAAYRLAGLLVNFASTAAIARALTVEGFGQLALAMGLMSLVGAFGLFGTDQLYLSRSIDPSQLQRAAGAAGFVALVVACSVAVVWPGIHAAERAMVALLGVGAALEIVRVSWLVRPQREHNYAKRARRELIARSGVSVAGVIGAFFLGGPLPVVYAMLVAQGLITIVAFVGEFRDHCQRPMLPTRSGFRTLRQGSPYALSSFLYGTYFAIDMALVGTISTADQAAYYRVAFVFISAAVSVPLAVNNEILRPQLFVAREEAFGHIASRFLRLSIVLGVLSQAAVLAVGLPILTTIFGNDYGPSVGLLVLLSFCLPFHYVNSWFGNVLVAGGHLGVVLRVQGLLVVGNLLGNLVLIPHYDAVGAAIATIVTEATGMMAYLVAYKWKIRQQGGIIQ